MAASRDQRFDAFAGATRGALPRSETGLMAWMQTLAERRCLAALVLDRAACERSGVDGNFADEFLAARVLGLSSALSTRPRFCPGIIQFRSFAAERLRHPDRQFSR